MKTVVHPDRLTTRPAVVSDEAFEVLYEPQGFVEYDPKQHTPKDADVDPVAAAGANAEDAPASTTRRRSGSTEG